jgi:hypothetical protein
MIDYYIIVDNTTPIETYIRSGKSLNQVDIIVKLIRRQSQKAESKIVKQMKIGQYEVYYFKQETFTFVLVT